MEPKNVGYLTELDEIYAKALKEISSTDDFQSFLSKWKYWLDDESKKLVPNDWAWIAPLLDDCRKEGVEPEEKHKPAMALAMPFKLVKVAIVKIKFMVPWGTAYIRSKEEGLIDF